MVNMPCLCLWNFYGDSYAGFDYRAKMADRVLQATLGRRGKEEQVFGRQRKVTKAQLDLQGDPANTEHGGIVDSLGPRANGAPRATRLVSLYLKKKMHIEVNVV